MDIVTAPGLPGSNSYIDAAGADAYLASRPGFDAAAWTALDAAAKAWRLVLAARILDASFRFRGVKACLDQRLSWPRLMPGDALYTEGYGPVVSFADWTELTDYADLFGHDYPSAPEEVGQAQTEIAFQVVHSHLVALGPYEDGEYRVESVNLGGKVAVKLAAPSGRTSPIPKEEVDALSVVRFLLAPWLAAVRGRSV